MTKNSNIGLHEGIPIQRTTPSSCLGLREVQSRMNLLTVQIATVSIQSKSLIWLLAGSHIFMSLHASGSRDKTDPKSNIYVFTSQEERYHSLCQGWDKIHCSFQNLISHSYDLSASYTWDQGSTYFSQFMLNNICIHHVPSIYKTIQDHPGTRKEQTRARVGKLSPLVKSFQKTLIHKALLGHITFIICIFYVAALCGSGQVE